MNTIPFTSILHDLPATTPFVGPETMERQRGRRFKVRIGANESAFGVSPKAAAAMRDAIEHISWYNDPEGFDLRNCLAAFHRLKLDEICLGAGIDELLGLVVRMVVEPNTPVVTSLGAYPTFNYHVTGFGGQLHQVLYRDDHIDLELLAEEVNRVRAPLVFLANPDNPMGTWHGAEQVQEFIDRLPEDCILILDEAYTDFGEDDIRPPIDTTDPRVIRMRTFSKAHGMAGARIGYAIAASEVVTGLNKIRNHFGVNRIAQAGALASMQDPKFLDEVVQEVKRGRVEYDELARRLGLSTVPSATNFVAFDLGDRTTARRVMNALLERDVFVRMPAVPPLDRCVRVTVGTPEERQFFSEVLAEVLKATHRDKR